MQSVGTSTLLGRGRLRWHGDHAMLHGPCQLIQRLPPLFSCICPSFHDASFSRSLLLSLCFGFALSVCCPLRAPTPADHASVRGFHAEGACGDGGGSAEKEDTLPPAAGRRTTRSGFPRERHLSTSFNPVCDNVSAKGRQRTGWSSKRHVTPTTYRVSTVYEHPREKLRKTVIIHNWRLDRSACPSSIRQNFRRTPCEAFPHWSSKSHTADPAAKVCLTGEWLYMCQGGEVMEKRATGCYPRPMVCICTGLSALRDNNSRLIRKRINVSFAIQAYLLLLRIVPATTRALCETWIRRLARFCEGAWGVGHCDGHVSLTGPHTPGARGRGRTDQVWGRHSSLPGNNRRYFPFHRHFSLELFFFACKVMCTPRIPPAER